MEQPSVKTEIPSQVAETYTESEMKIETEKKEDDVIASGSQNAMTGLIAKFTNALQTAYKNKPSLFAYVNIAEEARRLEVWICEKPKRAARYRDLNRFSLNWLNRAQEDTAYKAKVSPKTLEDAQKDSWTKELEEAHKETLASQKEEVNADGE
jgi:hypothetical protein